MNDSELYQIKGASKYMTTKCNVYSCIAFWTRKEKRHCWDSRGNLNGLYGLDGSVVPYLFLDVKGCLLLCRSDPVRWKIHSGLFKSDGTSCLQFALSNLERSRKKANYTGSMHMHRHTQSEQWSNTMLTTWKSGWREHGSSSQYFGNFSIHLKLF